MMHKRVIFKGQEFWFNDESSLLEATLSPLDHFDESGKLLAPLGSISYAVIEGDKILRHHEVIGTIDDLEKPS